MNNQVEVLSIHLGESWTRYFCLGLVKMLSCKLLLSWQYMHLLTLIIIIFKYIMHKDNFLSSLHILFTMKMWLIVATNGMAHLVVGFDIHI